MSVQQSELSSEERSERYGPLQQHRRAVASLHKQIKQKTAQLEEVSSSLWSTVRSTHTMLGPQLCCIVYSVVSIVCV